MENSDQLRKGLNETYKKLIEFKKYKKTPLIVSKNGQVVEVAPETIINTDNIYNK